MFAALRNPQRPEPALKNLGKYEVLGELGHGAMGIVYRARDPMINRLVALKTITTGVADDPELLQRFYREAQSAGGLQHPNIVTIYDMGQADELPYIAMELVEGENLEQLIARHAELPITLKLDYAMQACRAFDFAHKRGIVHRDIKPGNVMVSKEGTVKVVDFGIARVLETSRTQTGMLIGTFAYMSPEQYHGEHADERSDIWSFGVLFYELLTHQRPFAGPTPASLMRCICDVEPTPLSKLLAGCPEELERTVSKMLSKSPSERYESMEDVLLDLDPICRALQSQSVGGLLDHSRRLLDQGSFAEARDLARQAFQLESGNPQARALLEQANAGLKRIQNRPKAQQLVEKGQAFLEQGKLQEAKVAAESALNLDSSFSPAEDLRRAIQVEVDRARLIAEWLDAARQYLAEGLPDDAESLLAKILEIEPLNAQAEILQQQVEKEKTERERSRRVLAAVKQAQELWTRRDYDECIQLLEDLSQEFPGQEEVSRLLETVREDRLGQQKQQGLEDARRHLTARRYEESVALLEQLQADFPDELEIKKLLAAAREDLAEEQKQQKLAGARGLIATQSFAEALALLDSLAAAHPEDHGVIKLREHVQREQEKQSKAERVRVELDALKKLMGEKKYPEVIAKAADLLKEFPSEPNFMRLAEFATSRQASIEKELLFDKILQQARAFFKAGRFEETIRAVQDGQKRFPANAELLALQAESETQQRKLQVRQQIEQRVREIRVKINREELSDAVNLAKQTLVTLGPDTDLSHLLSSAEVELQAREKKRIQERTLETIRTLVESGDLDGASRTIDQVLQSKTLDSFDPRIQRLSEQVKDARTKSAEEPATSEPPTGPALSKEYAFLQAAPLPRTPVSPEVLPASDSSTARSLASTSVLPPCVAPATSPEPLPAAPLPLEVASLEQASVTPLAQAAATGMEPAAQPPSAPVLKVEANEGVSSVVLPATVKTVLAARPAAVRYKLMAVVLTILALVVFSAVWTGLRSSSSRLRESQLQLMETANTRLAANDMDGALSILQQPEALKGPLTQEIQEKLAQVKKAKADADLRELRLKEEQLWGTAKGLVEKGRYTEAQQTLENILALPSGGVHRTEAQRYLDKTNAQLQAQKYLAQGDFSSARRAADVLQQKGGDATELVTKINQAERRELNQLKNQLDQLKRRNDEQAVQQLQALQPKFQTLAADGGPLSQEALSYAESVPGAIAGVRARASKKSAGSKTAGSNCDTLRARMQLGESLNEEDRASFAKCQ
jgi:serine/threonine protein kinase